MPEKLEAVTVAALGLALDAASLRQQAIAANIANANVAGYLPVNVSFEDQLEDARRVLDRQGTLDMASLASVVPRLESATDPGPLGQAPKVMLDVQVAELAKNTMHYQALVKGLAKHYGILATAVSDGKK